VAQTAIRQELSAAIFTAACIPFRPEFVIAVNGIVRDARERLHVLLMQQQRGAQDHRVDPSAIDPAELRRRRAAQIAAELYDPEGDDLIERIYDAEPQAAGTDDHDATAGPALLAEGRLITGRYESALHTLISARLVSPLLTSGERAYTRGERVWARRFFLGAEVVRERENQRSAD